MEYDHEIVWGLLGFTARADELKDLADFRCYETEGEAIKILSRYSVDGLYRECLRLKKLAKHFKAAANGSGNNALPAEIATPIPFVWPGPPAPPRFYQRMVDAAFDAYSYATSHTDLFQEQLIKDCCHRMDKRELQDYKATGDGWGRPPVPSEDDWRRALGKHAPFELARGIFTRRYWIDMAVNDILTPPPKTKPLGPEPEPAGFSLEAFGELSVLLLETVNKLEAVMKLVQH